MNGVAWRRGLATLADHGLLFEIQIFASQMADGARLAKSFPETIFVLEHAGMLEDMSPAGLQLWRERLKFLADCPNVNVKLSGLGTFVHACQEDLMKLIVTETVALFGADRCLFGSNFPIEKLWTDYKTLYRTFRNAIADFTDREQAAILHDTAARLYRIG
jgi:predicted TIM-barrel fold metal-dependent hydrolase